MTRMRLVWAAGLVVWAVAALGVLRVGATADDPVSCPVSGPWG